jgi:hypothetical protein
MQEAQTFTPNDPLEADRVLGRRKSGHPGNVANSTVMGPRWRRRRCLASSE